MAWIPRGADLVLFRCVNYNSKPINLFKSYVIYTNIYTVTFLHIYIYIFKYLQINLHQYLRGFNKIYYLVFFKGHLRMLVLLQKKCHFPHFEALRSTTITISLKLYDVFS